MKIFRLLAVTTILPVAFAHQSSADLVQGFEGNPAINSIGDASIKSTYQGVTAPQGSNQFLITTINAGGMDGTDGYSNQSGANAVSNMNLQNFLGVGLSGSEGSGFTLSIVVPVGFDTISFQYDFLTNELPSGNGAMQHQDFATFVLFNSSNALVASGGVTPANINFNDPARQLAVGPTATNPFFFDTGYLTFTKAGLAPGTYTVGFAVEDKTTSDIPSGLLVDNVQVLAAVPEASTVALAIAGAVLLVAVRLRTKRA